MRGLELQQIRHCCVLSIWKVSWRWKIPYIPVDYLGIQSYHPYSSLV